MLLSTCFTLSFTLRDWMAMKAVQSKNTISIMHPPLWVEISPVEPAHDEIAHSGTLAGKNKLHLNEMPLLLLSNSPTGLLKIDLKRTKNTRCCHLQCLISL